MSGQRLILLFVLFFISGATGLLYQVMWMKELTLLLGGSTQSAAVTTMAFFLGLGLGANFIAKWVAKRKARTLLTFRDHLNIYAFLELMVAASALLYFAIYPLFHLVYAQLFTLITGSQALLLLLKLLLAIPLLSLPAFFMGGTLPVMAELVTDITQRFAKRVSSIYFINTLGACLGAIIGGFWLPRVLGYTKTYFVAVGLSLGLALVTWGFRKTVKASVTQPVKQTNIKPPSKPQALRQSAILLVAAWSGFASLALQVLWTRLFAQVMQNSTYTFSAILVVFLLALSFGAFIANRLTGIKQAHFVLPVLFLLSGLSIALTPSIYMQVTHNMRYLGGSSDFIVYMMQVLASVALVIGMPVTIIGICLPFLYKLVQQQVHGNYALTVGRINSINTYAAILGSAFSGFVLFQWLGTWQAIHAIGLCYVMFALILFASIKRPITPTTWVVVASLAVLTVLLNPAHLPAVPIDPVAKKERLIEVWESSAGTVSVVEKDGNLKTKLNNWYALGGSKAGQMEAMQTHLPVILHGHAESVFYLGLGTGVTAGTVLNYPVKSVVVAELVDQVITASKRYFTEFNNGLFDDDRVTVVNEDGRHYLQASTQTFDLIIADLFIPWRAGVGNLYALEHYQNARQKLNDNGLYVQWLPMYQISEAELGVIANTMQQAFELVTVWRGDFFAQKPVMALIGHKTKRPLSSHSVFRELGSKAIQDYSTKGQVPLLSHYVGELSENMPFLLGKPLNTDDYPVIEYTAPMSHRAQKNGTLHWLTETYLLEFMHQMRSTQRGFLRGLTETEINAIYAGYFLHAAQIAKAIDDKPAQRHAMQEFNKLIQ